MKKKTEIGQCLLHTMLDHRKITQQELSDMTGINKSQLSRYAHGESLMSLKTARLIAQHLKCHIDDLYEWGFPK